MVNNACGFKTDLALDKLTLELPQLVPLQSDRNLTHCVSAVTCVSRSPGYPVWGAVDHFTTEGDFAALGPLSGIRVWFYHDTHIHG